MTTQPKGIDALTILVVMHQMFGKFFPQETWRPWFLCAAALFGLTDGLTPDDQAFILQCLGRSMLPTAQALRAFLIVGRRGGKSRFAALLAVYLACFRSYTLAPGERGVGMVIAPDRRQAMVIFRYITALIDSVPMLAALVEGRTKEAIHFGSGISIEVHTASFRAVRGYTIVFAIVDEGAFLPTDDSADPDTELMAALGPAMTTVPNAILMMVSTPYARRGELWKAHRDHFGKDGSDVLVWQAATRMMNPAVAQGVIDRAYAEDEAVALAEFGAQFRRDIELFIGPDVLEAVTVSGRIELPPRPDHTYVAFVDPAGGSGGDSMTLAIAHAETRDGQTVAVLDLVREVHPPFSPESATAGFAAAIKPYVAVATGDRFGGEWPREALRRYGVDYDVAQKTKSDIYREVLPLLNSCRVELLDDRRLRAQLAGLERRVGRGGRDTIDHPPGGHDDVGNAVAGALVLALAQDAVPEATLEPPATGIWYPLYH